MGLGESRFREVTTKIEAHRNHSVWRFGLGGSRSTTCASKSSGGRRQRYWTSLRTLRCTSENTSSAWSSSNPRGEGEGTIERQYSFSLSCLCRFFSSADLSLTILALSLGPELWPKAHKTYEQEKMIEAERHYCFSSVRSLTLVVIYACCSGAYIKSSDKSTTRGSHFQGDLANFDTNSKMIPA